MSFLVRHSVLLALLLLVAGWSIFLYVVGPSAFVAFIGAENGYLLIFIAALLSGSFSLTSLAFYATLLALAAGGLNPFLLGLIAGIGEIGGDSLFYFIGHRGRHVSREFWDRFEKRVNRARDWLLYRPPWMMPLVIFAYSGFTPFPNDVVTTSLGFVRYGYVRTIAPLLLGNIVRATGIAYLVAQGVL